MSELIGGKEMSQLLRDLPKQVEGAALQKAAYAGANVLRNEVRRAAPSSKAADRSPSSKEFGRIRSNIRVRRGKNEGSSSRRFAFVYIKRSFWASFLEFGTSHQAAKPFFRPAIDRKSRDALAAMTAKLADAVTAALAKLRR
jgi:HK97 gp10 family phage protein